jgi:hypothetical protein
MLCGYLFADGKTTQGESSGLFLCQENHGIYRHSPVVAKHSKTWSPWSNFPAPTSHLTLTESYITWACQTVLSTSSIISFTIFIYLLVSLEHSTPPRYRRALHTMNFVVAMSHLSPLISRPNAPLLSSNSHNLLPKAPSLQGWTNIHRYT